MKVRLGFVSNSSSSSFIVAGFEFNDVDSLVDAVRKIAGEKFVTIESKVTKLIADDEYWEIPYLMDQVLPEGISCESLDECCDTMYLGKFKNPESMSLEDCRNGFLTDEQYEELRRISDLIDLDITVDGGEMYN
ncbi:hypothetical protein VPHD479_0134 [Vibrio phage D479]